MFLKIKFIQTDGTRPPLAPALWKRLFVKRTLLLNTNNLIAMNWLLFKTVLAIDKWNSFSFQAAINCTYLFIFYPIQSRKLMRERRRTSSAFHCSGTDVILIYLGKPFQIERASDWVSFLERLHFLQLRHLDLIKAYFLICLFVLKWCLETISIRKH